MSLNFPKSPNATHQSLMTPENGYSRNLPFPVFIPGTERGTRVDAPCPLIPPP